MDHRRELKGDCARCAGLCCVALGFDAGESFAFDKPADDPCRHLRRDHACGIHGQLAQRGFAGCASYDCYGAGQRVSQMFGAESSWRERPELAGIVCETFRALSTLHELRFVLAEAARLELLPEKSAELAALMLRLEPEEGWTPRAVLAADRETLHAEVHAFLRSLRSLVTLQKRSAYVSSKSAQSPRECQCSETNRAEPERSRPVARLTCRAPRSLPGA